MIDPALRDVLGETLLLDQRTLGLGEQLFAPEQIEQAKADRDASDELVQHARVDDVRVDYRAGRMCLAHSGGAPIASSSRDHCAVRRSLSSRRCSKASTDVSGIFQ
jgi:hypothetical protein